jgi:hypothetical protein
LDAVFCVDGGGGTGKQYNQYYEKGPDASLKVVERQGKEC